MIAAVKAAGYRGATSEVPGLATSAHPYVLNRIEITAGRRAQRVRVEAQGGAGRHSGLLGQPRRVSTGLRWAEKDGVRWLEAELPGAAAAFSTRLGGVSEPPFDSLNLGRLTGDPGVRENRDRLAAALGIDPRGVLIGRQVHGAEVQPPRPSRTEPAAFADPRSGPRRRPTVTRPIGPGSRPSSSSPTASRSRWRGLEAWR